MGSPGIQSAKSRNLNVSIRPYHPDDRSACFQVFRRAVHEGAANAYTAEQRAAWCPATEPDLSTPDRAADMVAYVACKDSQIIGFMAMEHDGHLDLAFVLPEWMGLGVAQALYDKLLEWAQDHHLIHLTTEASLLARPFFAKNGWDVVTPETILRHGQRIDRFRMAIDLERPDNEKTI
ncbi:GNAT family N-acetyltransferase [Cochlodiniinecator piscidefendens]|uniref:GNAT family N-acetyltransferase n=1 Tax=Cochlodiniinecator piscidefendens TaxID=2715756 RepID=UPI00140CF022